uniref:V-type proton ATPase subunit H n=1 Tax=Dunaliella tertiolecta TaxID=3047 RepID=A0A7S3RAK0_DUNTE|mmetsp:Transcript_12614/g.34471  ORF Transcript_12614/g.34471 Transcript_12614/m.34471 type:complete len:470 (+) Transcript_12614:101-1510(+)
MAQLLEDHDIQGVLQRNIPWESYMTARLISEKDLQAIRRYDKRVRELRNSMLSEAGPTYVHAFMSVLKAVSKEETVQYVLAILLQMLQEEPARAVYFHQRPEHAEPSTSMDPFIVFLRLLQRQDWFTQEKSAKLLMAVVDSRPNKAAFSNGILACEGASSAACAAYGGPDPAEQHLGSFIEWLIGQLRRPSNPNKSVPTVTSILSVLLRERGARLMFLRSGGIGMLPPLLRALNSPTNSQLLYELVMCVWQLTFHKEAALALGGAGVVRPLVDVTRTAQKEKVFRVALSSLRNLLEDEDLHNNLASEMVDSGLHKIVATRQLQSWGDEDVPELLTTMEDKLRHGIQMMSSFDKYRKELMSGHLDWGPSHTSESFWRKNVDKFEERDFFVLRTLLKLIETSQEPKTLAVGCHDLSQFIQFHPQGRYIVSGMRGKELVMQLMAHPDSEVQKQALLCVQRIMLSKHNLDFLR